MASNVATVDAHPRSGRGVRLSIWHYLLVLSLLPLLAVPAVGSLLIRDRLEVASSTRSIEQSMRVVTGLDKLRLAINAESSDTALRGVAVAFGLTLTKLNAALGSQLATPVSDTRAATDEALTSLKAVDPGDPEVTRLVNSLELARKYADSTISTPAASRAGSFKIAKMFTDSAEQAAFSEQTLTSDLARGTSGALTAPLLKAVSQLADVTSLVIAGGQQVAQVYLITVAPSNQQAPLKLALSSATGAYTSFGSQIKSGLSPALAASWKKFSEGNVEGTFEALANTWLTAAQIPVITNDAKKVAAFSLLITGFSSAISDLLTQAVSECAATAHTAGVSAENAAWITGGLALALVLLTLSVLTTVSVLIRRRLLALAAAAQKLSAGQLQPSVVHGPREVAAAGTALNDAAAVLREVVSRAELVSSGDLTSAEFMSTTPGGLGAAVDTSLRKVLAVMRERERLQERVTHQATHDSLTGLPNRAQAEVLITEALAGGHRDTQRVGLLFIDLDKFKQCNDTLGHQAGDYVLQVTAARMRTQLRPGDSAFRLGGDEFVILLASLGPEDDVLAVAGRLEAALAAAYSYQGKALSVTASIGAAVAEPGDFVTYDELLRRADIAVYEVKRSGGGNTHLYAAPTASVPVPQARRQTAPLPRPGAR